MPRDYANRSGKQTSQHKGASRSSSNTNRTRSSQSASPGGKFQVFLFGFILGVITMWAIPPLQDELTTKKANEDNPTIVENSKPEPDKPSLEFYNMLKDSEIIVPATEPATAPKEDQKNYIYLLQVASFKDAKDADAHRAELILLGLDASVETASPTPNQVRHRVLVGPFTTSAEVSEARTRLAENNIESLLLKREK